MSAIYRFFDKLEDKVRGKLSHYPILYAFFGGVGVVIFWRGVWHTADFVMEFLFVYKNISDTIDAGGMPWYDGPLSIVIGGVLLLMTGLFVSGFIGNEIIISGLRGEKKMTEKTEMEIKTEASVISEIKKNVAEITNHISHIEENLGNNKQH